MLNVYKWPRTEHTYIKQWTFGCVHTIHMINNHIRLMGFLSMLNVYWFFFCMRIVDCGFWIMVILVNSVHICNAVILLLNYYYCYCWLLMDYLPLEGDFINFRNVETWYESVYLQCYSYACTRDICINLNVMDLLVVHRCCSQWWPNVFRFI